MKIGRRIFKNMLSLSVAEAANKGIALITTAYLARILTPDGYGIIGWANAYIIYFVFLVDLGFNVVGPREIAKAPEKIKKYVNNITSIKFLFALILYSALAISVYFINKPIEIKSIVLIYGLNIFANSILFNWVFQGIEKMEIIAIRQVVTSSLTLIGVLLFVHSPSNTITAVSIIVASLLINSIWMMIYYIKRYGAVKFEYDFTFWKELLQSSIPVALTIFITILYNYFSTFLLGLYRSEFETGIFTAAFKVMAFTLVPSGILQNAFIPQLARSQTIEERQKFASKYILFMFLIGTIITIGFFTYSDYIVVAAFGSKYIDSIPILKLLMITGLLSYMNVSYSAPLLSWKFEKKIIWAMLSGGLVNLILNFVLIPIYGAEGAAITSVITEFTVLIGLLFIMNSAIHKTFILKFLLIFLYAIVSCGIGYGLNYFGLHPIAAGTVSFIVFVLINLLFKTITIEEIKQYLKK